MLFLYLFCCCCFCYLFLLLIWCCQPLWPCVVSPPVPCSSNNTNESRRMSQSHAPTDGVAVSKKNKSTRFHGHRRGRNPALKCQSCTQKGHCKHDTKNKHVCEHARHVRDLNPQNNKMKGTENLFAYLQFFSCYLLVHTAVLLLPHETILMLLTISFRMTCTVRT